MKQFKLTFLGVILAGAFSFIQPVSLSAQEVIEDFERTDNWSWSPWIGTGGGKSSLAAHTGSYGVVDPGWHYRTDVTVGKAGDVLTAWGKSLIPGRVYLGFSASSLGAYSLIMATNTQELIIQHNSGFGVSSNLAAVPFTYELQKWYKLEITWITENSIEAKLYDSDGTTVLATVSHTSTKFTPGGIAIRAFSRGYLDDISYGSSCSSPVVKTNDLTVELDSEGNALISTDKINNDSEVSCGIAEITLDKENFNCKDIGGNTVTLTITDENGNIASATATVTVEDNLSPAVVTQDITVALDANGEATITSDAIDNGSTDNCAIASYSLDITSFDCSNIGENTVTLTVTDESENTASATAVVTVTNDEPQITSFHLPEDAQQVGTTINLTATYTDVNLSQASVNWGDGSETTADIEDGNISANHMYSEAGIYEVVLNIIDICGLEAQETYQYVIIYDPNAGFITGGGWFSSPVGAWAGNTATNSKAHVQFNAKYQKNTYELQGKFNFTLTRGAGGNNSGAGGNSGAILKFKSTSLNWLVVNDHKAYLTGSGEIDNNDNYSFLLSFIDGDKIGERADYIRVQITDNSNGNVIYDNYLNAPMPADATQELDNGSLVIHNNGNSSGANRSSNTADDELLSFSFYPNPAVDNLTLDFTNFTSKKARFTITNSMGKVETSREVNISATDKVRINVRNLNKGIYVITVETDNGKHMYRFYKS
ncbi:MAG: T9SS type A sorting domain-containing protein [Candidatus Cyclobacteriaceae bacterium M2_1C_046]